jgi:hypothetical protein
LSRHLLTCSRSGELNDHQQGCDDRHSAYL